MSLEWVCPDCGTVYYAVGTFDHCPKCKALDDEKMVQWRAERKESQRVVASEILARFITTK